MVKQKRKQNSFTYLAVVISAITVLLWCAYYAYSRQITGFDLSVYRFVNDLPSSLYPFFIIITQFGSIWALFGVTLVALLFKHKRLALRIFTNGTIAVICIEITKHLIARPRPIDLLDKINVREVLVYGYGFPSGHTAIATVISLTIMPYLPKNLRWLSFMWIALVGMSRIYLGVHAPLDVIGGIAIGAAVVYGSYLLKNKLLYVTKITHTKMVD